MAKAHHGNGHPPAPSLALLRDVFEGLAKERGWIATKKWREQIGDDDGKEEWFLPVGRFLEEPDTPPEYIVEPFVFAKSFTLLVGPPKGGKTWFLSWLAAESAARGKRVHFVEQEGSRSLLRSRLRPFFRTLDASAAGRVSIAHRAPLMVDNAKAVDELLGQIKGCDLLILDPLVMLHTRDENEAGAIAVVLHSILRIIREVGCAVLVAHHSNKGESWNKKSTQGSDSVQVRGSGAIVGAADSVLFLRAVPEDQRQHAQIRFYLSNPDTRMAEPFERRLAVVKLSDDGGGAVQFFDPSSPSTTEGAAQFLARILPFVPAAPGFISIDLLADKAKMRKSRVQLAVELGQERGQFQRAKEGRKQGVQRT